MGFSKHSAIRAAFVRWSAISAAGTLAITLIGLPAYAAPPAVAGPVSLVAQVILPAGSANGSVLVKTVPRDFRLVIQTVSYFRSNVAAGSIGQVFLQTTLNKTTGYFALPESVADGAIYPAQTLNATIYCDVNTPLVINAYRSGSDTAQETVNIIINGVYEAYPPPS